ncbi:Retinoic acid induced 16-like protein-domain-containing protein [Sporodiniella umbellata]|nr:Retinoic acid induced 16-like protein-domain-containing protein [Sporodiniella umbellata]
MSMFLSKLLAGRNNSKTKLELLAEAWTNIQKYYETARDPLRDAVDLTPIPSSLQNVIKLIQAEEVEYQRPSGSLEAGPCLEYLLERRVLEELVEFAKVDTPYGMRIHCLRFFYSLVANVEAQLLPERAVHVPLQKLITSCHRLITHHYEQVTSDPEACSEERVAAISELSLELVKLIHGVFSHFKGTNAALMDLFFERGWCRGLGESVWRSSKDGKSFHKRRESVEDKISWGMFLTPRFDMFTYLIDYMNVPGETGEIAREAILFALRLLDNDPEYVCYIVEYSGLCEVIAERLSLYFANLSKNKGAFTISENNRVIPTKPPRRPVRFSVPAMITNNSLIITVNAQNSFKRKRRKRSPFDSNFVRMIVSAIDKEMIAEEFYNFWEYLNDIARVAEKRLMTALMAQLTTMFWHPVVCTALSSPYAETATAATAYTTEMIRCLTDQRLIHVFLVVLISEEGGVGKDMERETKLNTFTSDFVDEDLDDASSQATDDETKLGNDTTLHTPKEADDPFSINGDEEMTLRLLLINRIDAEKQELALSSLRLFDTILETYNQFAIYNLVLRNYLDISPDGEYITYESEDSVDTLSLGSKTVDEFSSDTVTEEQQIPENSASNENGTEEKDSKNEKVRWLVERLLSLLPLEDELERIKSPLPSNITQLDSYTSNVCRQENSKNGKVPYALVPGNSYDDYFHEAQERFRYALLAKNFWKTTYPPVKSKRDIEREVEDQKGRPLRPKSMMLMSSTTVDQMSISSTMTNTIVKNKIAESYEGLFLSRIFAQFCRMFELPVEQNLLVTSILQKLAGVVDKRMDGVICDWRSIHISDDGTMYGGVWTVPSTKVNRKSLYALLEQITFEALKRAQLVPNFETRISIAKKRGMAAGSSDSQSNSVYHSDRHTGTLRKQSSLSTLNSNDSKQAVNASKLTFSKGSSSTLLPSSPRSPTVPSPTKSAGLLPLRINRDTSTGSGLGSPISPSSSFFQNSQRVNATPVTMTNPFAKLSNFVNSYIVLQEFCKELAAVVLVRHATNYNEIGFVKYQEQREMSMIDSENGTNNQNPQDWMMEEVLVDEEEMSYKQKHFDKWKNRISVVSTLADYRSVRSLDIVDEAIAARVPLKPTGSTERNK